MAVSVKYRQALTGDTSISLDNILSTVLLDGDFSFTVDTGVIYGHRYDSVSTAISDGLAIVIPADLPAAGRWILQTSPFDSGDVVPVGSTIMWDNVSPPAGYLERDGAEISRVTYSNLFAILGTVYGLGDGTTTFNLPDSRGQFLRSWDHGALIDPDAATRLDRGDGTVGDALGTLQSSENLSHTHALTNLDYWVEGGATGRYAAGTGLAYYAKVYAYANGGLESRPTNMNIMYCIKY